MALVNIDSAMKKVCVINTNTLGPEIHLIFSRKFIQTKRILSIM